MIFTPRESIVQDLKDYGEDESASQILHLSAEDWNRFDKIASKHAYTGMLLAKAVALAAVEITEGKPRELKRKRRIFKR
jgi:hypothetical protein